MELLSLDAERRLMVERGSVVFTFFHTHSLDRWFFCSFQLQRLSGWGLVTSVMTLMNMITIAQTNTIIETQCLKASH